MELLHTLADEGAAIRAYDPKAMDKAALLAPGSVELVNNIHECADGVQALVLMTEWPEFVDADWRAIARGMRPPRFLFDGRNALEVSLMRECGLDYQGVGRGTIIPVEFAGF